VAHKNRKLKAIPTPDLFKKDTAEYSAETHWRIAFPIACLIMTLIAVPLSVVNPRQGKFAKMLPALLLFLGYFLMLTAVRSGVESSTIPKNVGLWPVHFFVFILGVSLLIKDRSSGLKMKAKLPQLIRNFTRKGT
jgi:lipopolysaccharide export system permease protein